MKNKRKKVNMGLIVMTKGERVAVINLLSVIAVLLAFSVFRPALRFSRADADAFHNLDSLIALQERAVPNEQSEVPPRAENIMVHTTTSPAASNATSASKTTAKTKTSPPAASKPVVNERKAIPVLDINVADSSALVALPQIGEVMASRIHRYRNRLGGYVSYSQLFEVKGMDTARFNTIKPYLTLDDGLVSKLRVNQDEFKTLLRHPYLEYDQVKAIVNHRERKGLIRDWEQLKGLIGEVNPLLERYIDY